MKVIIFGGSGFLGSYVVDVLVSEGHKVVVYDLKEGIVKNKKVNYVLGDIMDINKVNEAMLGVDVVYNFAGLSDLNNSIDNPRKTLELNIMGNFNILNSCLNHNIKRFIYASSAYVFSSKGAFYGVSKKSSEMIIQEFSEQYGLDYTVIRYGSVYGERADESNRIYRLLQEALTTGGISFPGDGNEEREYIHARDAAKLSVDILSRKYINERVILTGIEKFSYSRLLDFINEIMGSEIKISYQNKDYKGHYSMTPYSFSPVTGCKLVNNPSVDFGQGILECLDLLNHNLKETS